MERNVKEKQKLDRRDTYTPVDAPQVRGNCDHALNRGRSLSLHGSRTTSNNPDVDILQPAGWHNTDAPVFVFSVKQRRRNNRSLQTNRKGFRPTIRRRRYGLQPGDTVLHMGKRFRISGSFSYGGYVWKEIRGNGQKREYLQAAEVRLVRYGRGISFE